jgi:hypothetical protein
MTGHKTERERIVLKVDRRRDGVWTYRPLIDTTVATGTAAVGLGPSRPVAAWIEWNESARSDTGGQIRIADPRGSAGELPQIPLDRSRGPSVQSTRASAHRPGFLLRLRNTAVAQWP